MTKRLFFTCPIKTLYMMKEFGVKFNLEGWPKYQPSDLNSFADIIETVNEMGRYGEIGLRNYVSLESEAIFEPKKGDEGRWQRRQGAHYANHNGEQWVSAGIEMNPPAIIVRDNKLFFFPEIEEDSTVRKS